ncbi:MAG: hypothetical protein HY738_21015 [Bacteroidia bacterium]|nr:hypothetical protein [Bacteroidia bacterium]
MKTKFDDEELDIIQNYENNKLTISKTRKIDMENAVKSAKDTIQRKAELSIKLTEKDLRNLKLKEIEIGIPYQNIITALIHKYLENKIELTI